MNNHPRIVYEVVEYGLNAHPVVVFSAPKKELAEQFRVESEKTALQNQQFGVSYRLREVNQSPFDPYRFCALISFGYDDIEKDIEIEVVFPVKAEDLERLETPDWQALDKIVKKLVTVSRYNKEQGPFLLAYGTNKAQARERLLEQLQNHLLKAEFNSLRAEIHKLSETGKGL